MRTVPSTFQTHLNTRTTTVCYCWKVVRTDGSTFGFTDHDKVLTFGGVNYEPTTAFNSSAIENQLGLAVSNLDIMGALSSDAITDSDLEAGVWDNAAVTVYLINWADVTQKVVTLKGTIGQVQQGDLAFQVEVRSLGQHFGQYIGSICQPKCRSNFGDTGTGLEGGCNFALPAAVTGTISAVTNRTTFTVSAVGSFPNGAKGSLSGGYFDYGTVKFTSGANIGLSREINTSNSSLNLVTIIPFPNDIAVSDAVQLQIGCDKTLETCRVNYNNVLNYRGEPFVPGSDFVFKVDKT